MRLVSLNTWKGDGAYTLRLTRMAEGLAALAPDLLALQEVLIAPAAGLHTAAHLAEALGLQAAVLPLRRKDRQVEGQSFDSWSGLAILSRLPILSQRAIELPADPRDGERAALAVEVEDRGRRILVVALHLTHLKDGAELRRRQWERVVEAVADAPTVLAAGDFNASSALLATTERFEDARRPLGRPPQPTVIGGGPEDCIDHIVFSRDGALVPIRYCRALTALALGQAASDHCAVVADFASAE